MIEETTTFAELEQEYGQLIDREADNDVRDFRWKYNIPDLKDDGLEMILETGDAE